MPTHPKARGEYSESLRVNDDDPVACAAADNAKPGRRARRLLWNHGVKTVKRLPTRPRKEQAPPSFFCCLTANSECDEADADAKRMEESIRYYGATRLGDK